MPIYMHVASRRVLIFLSFVLFHCSGFMCLFDGPVLVSSSSSSLSSEGINSTAFFWLSSSLSSSCPLVIRWLCNHFFVDNESINFYRPKIMMLDELCTGAYTHVWHITWLCTFMKDLHNQDLVIIALLCCLTKPDYQDKLCMLHWREWSNLTEH